MQVHKSRRKSRRSVRLRKHISPSNYLTRTPITLEKAGVLLASLVAAVVGRTYERKHVWDEERLWL